MTTTTTAGAALTKGTIRTLSPREMPLLRDHLLRLDRDSRRNRFNGVVDDSFIEAYTAKCASDGTIVVAYLTDGEVHGAAELHQPEQSPDHLPEMAFSVERDVRRQGLGSVLFQKVLEAAERAGFARVRITTGSENEPMKALARKFGATLTFGHGESTGIIELKNASASAGSLSGANDQVAKNPLPLRWSARGVATPVEFTRASLAFSRWYWRQVFRAWDLQRPA